jgi:co-chaperonin GroES (HSP10)
MSKVLGNKVLVKCFKGESKTEGGLFVPEAFQKESNRVEIIEVGKGTKDRPMTLKKGDIGYRVKSWGEPIEIDGEQYYLMEDKAIIALEHEPTDVIY